MKNSKKRYFLIARSRTLNSFPQPLHYPTNALTCVNFMVIKTTLKCENCSDMLRFTQEPSSGSKCQYLVKKQIWFDVWAYERGQYYDGIFGPVVRACSVPCRKGLCFLQIYGILKADQLNDVQNDESSKNGYKSRLHSFDGRSVGKWLVRSLRTK